MVFLGLGNPGQEYIGTRHNIGFEIIEELSRKISLDNNFVVEGWKGNRDFKIDVFKARHKSNLADKNIYLCKPLGYMNRSGQVFRAYADYFKLFHDEGSKEGRSTVSLNRSEQLPLIVVHDEIDFEPGVVKIKLGGSAGGHNGIKDILSSFSTEWFYRLRVGVGHPGSDVSNRGDLSKRGDVSDWVLGKPFGLDREKLKFAESLSVDSLLRFLSVYYENTKGDSSNNGSRGGSILDKGYKEVSSFLANSIRAASQEK